MTDTGPGPAAGSPRCRLQRDSADVVVIGAGAGGLAAAVRLAAAGRRVVVCEQDRHVGGTAHVFRRRGFVFPAGPLSFTVPAFLARTLSELGVREPLRLERDVFQVRRGPLDVIISTPLEQVARQLVRAFPGERTGIEAMVGLLRDLGSAARRLSPDGLTTPGPWTAVSSPAAPMGPDPQNRAALELLRTWGGVSASDLLARHIRDPRLRDLLGSQGVSEPSMPVVLLAGMWDFMAESGIWYPVDGVGTVGESLAARLRQLGGDLRLGVPVAGVLVRAGRAVGVRLHDGTEVRADLVISDADYRHTLLELVPGGALGLGDATTIGRMPLTPSVFAVFLGVRADGVDLSALRGHQLLLKLEEGPEVAWTEKRAVVDDFLTDELWVCWWSRHPAQRVWSTGHGQSPAGPATAAVTAVGGRPEGVRREPLAPDGHEALVIKVMAPVAPFLSLDGLGRRRHAAAYYVLKEQMADALVSAAERAIPGLSGAVTVREVATPLTYRDWGHRSDGSVAGWSWRAGDVPEPWAQDLVVTPLPGLLAVGLQSYTRLFLGGLGTSLYSGSRAACLALAEAAGGPARSAPV